MDDLNINVLECGFYWLIFIIMCFFLIYIYFVFKFVYSMLKVRESRLKMSVFSVVNMVIGKNMYSVCVCFVYGICLFL